MRRTYFFRRCLAAVVALAILCAAILIVKGAVGALTAASTTQVESSGSYVVRSGDTLWALAEAIAPGSDPRDVVDRIAEVNGSRSGDFDVNRPLTPGQEIALPELN